MCPSCSLKNRKKTVVSNQTPKKSIESKNLKKIRVVGGQNDREVIMVSASDYEDLIALGSYEPVEDAEKALVPMKEVYGKRKSPYKRDSTDKTVHGPRMRVIIGDSKEEPTLSVKSTEWLDEDGLMNSLNDLSDIDEYVPRKKTSRKKKVEGEQGWSI